MRNIVVGMTIVLSLSGLALWFGAPGDRGVGWAKAVSLAHIWIGSFFLVLFPLYAWDHVSHNRAWLRRFAGVTVSGVVQGLAAVLLVVSGAVLLLYGNQVWVTLRAAHYYLTYPLAAALGVHYLSRKT